ncbi:ferritin-like domain-containing protein [Mucilaginibacter sp. JRF]|uniref:ferritin-like domain-containing protein n=1 Tax=Mucilaginibacter sp. JRF TaxID=2780088 RepID=UPI001882D93A|nr:ferritin-like domain-containing protein [Mucilaginibacter sp. JRF]MBE9583352.1 ferritin-like domain-containing protein [Mucilaginibacter sp. JRF]
MKKETGTEPKFNALETPEDDNAILELFKDGIMDIYWAENHLVKNLPKMIAAATSKDLKKAIENHLEETKTHVARLEDIFGLLNEKVLAKKCDAMEGLTKEGEGIIESTEAGTDARDIGIILASQKVEHYEIATYGGLAALATHLGLVDVAGLLNNTLTEENTADKKLTDVTKTIIKKA